MGKTKENENIDNSSKDTPKKKLKAHVDFDVCDDLSTPEEEEMVRQRDEQILKKLRNN